MNPRAGIITLMCYISILSAQAQAEMPDSAQLKKEKEIHINQDALKNIQFNFISSPQLNESQPLMHQDKPWMRFRKELPQNMTDTITARKKEYIRMLPYSIWEYDNSHMCVDDTLTFKLKLDYLKDKYRPMHQPLVEFDMDKLLFENFTKRGRTIKRNRKRAKAWKIYNDYVPTKEDSLKWYGNKKRIPKDTLTTPADSINDNHFINTK